MSIRRVVPDIKSERVDESREFYVGVLGFKVAMDMGWVVTFASPTNPTAQITVMRNDRSFTAGTASHGRGRRRRRGLRRSGAAGRSSCIPSD